MQRWLILVAVTTSCDREAPAGADAPALYAKLCTTCHGSDGRPTAAMIARLGVRDLTSPELRARVSPALVEQQVRDGSTNKLMPAFAGLLTEEQIRALGVYVAGPAFGPRETGNRQQATGSGQ